MTATILDKIVEDKKRELAQQKIDVPLEFLKEQCSRQKPLDLRKALSGKGIKLITEIKKASPSKGLLCPDFKPVELAKEYAYSGAAAISVLTEADHFQGSLKYLNAVREAVKIPLLRKDFIFDEYQVYETAVNGADALLLITAILDLKQMQELLELSHSLGLSCLVEVHDKAELDKALQCGAEIIGINNRDLKTFVTDIETTHRLREFIPSGKTVVSESGILTRDHVTKLKAWDINAILVGEALVTSNDIPARVKELIS